MFYIYKLFSNFWRNWFKTVLLKGNFQNRNISKKFTEMIFRIFIWSNLYHHRDWWGQFMSDEAKCSNINSLLVCFKCERLFVKKDFWHQSVSRVWRMIKTNLMSIVLWYLCKLIYMAADGLCSHSDHCLSSTNNHKHNAWNYLSTFFHYEFKPNFLLIPVCHGQNTFFVLMT